MTKYTSGRVQRLPQSGITTDRYEFLGLEQAEPDLGDPIVGVASVAANPFNGSIYDWYIVASDSSGTGKRYWLPKDIVLADGTKTAGSVTVRNNGFVTGFANGVSDLNFKGGITVTAPGSVAGIGSSAVDIQINSVPEAESAGISSNLKGGNAGSIPYQQTTDITVFLDGPTIERQILSYDTATNTPTWSAITNLDIMEVEERLNDQSYYLTYAVSTGSTSTIGIAPSVLSFNPSRVRLGIGKEVPESTLDVVGTLSVSGLSTFASNVDINASIDVDGHTELDDLNVSGVSTFSNNVDISGTDKLLDVASSANFSGVTTISTLTATSLSPDGIGFGSDLYVPVANDSGSWSWQPVYDAGAGSLDGISIFENSEIKANGTIVALDFVSRNYSIQISEDPETSATIKFSENPNFDSITVGINSTVGIGSSGINVSGFVTTTDLKVTNNATIDKDLTVTGNLTVNGETTTINSVTLTVDDKLISLASTTTPSDAGADGGGIELKGNTDHTILWSNANDSWDFSENVNITTGNVYRINNASVLSATSLGVGVTNSSLTALGTITTGIWQGSQIDDDYIGTINNSNKVYLSALDIDGGTETTEVVDADLLIIDDGANGTNRKVTASNLKSYMGSNLALSGSLNGNLDLNGYNIIGTTGNIDITQNIKAGIITATTFVGNLTGTATTATDLSRSVEAGAGLTGGGALTSDVTLNIGVGTGITVNADDIELKNSSSLTDNTVLKWDDGNGQLVNSSITDNGTTLTVTNIDATGIVTAATFSGSFSGTATGIDKKVNAGAGLTGGGTLTSDVTLNIGEGTGIKVNVDDIALKNAGSLTTNRVLKWDGTQLVNSSITDNGSLVGIGTSIKLGYGIQDSTNSTGGTNYVPVANGSGGWSWKTVGSSGAGALTELSGNLSGNINLNEYNITGTGGINITGIVTATTFVGNLTGTADSVKNFDNFSDNTVLKWDDGNGQLTNSSITDNGTLVSIGTTTKLGGIQDSTNSTGGTNYVPVANGSGGWSWKTVGSSGAGALTELSGNLSGNINLNEYNITGTGGINISGIITATTFAGNLTGTADSVNKNVNTGTNSGLSGGGVLTSDLSLSLKNVGNLSGNAVLKWDNSNKQLTNSSITDNGTLVSIGTTTKLGGIRDSGDSTGGTNYVPVANGSGGWAWGSVTSAGGITGVTVSEEESAISATAFKTLNFVSPNITATDAGGQQANITLTNNPTFANINATGIVGIGSTQPTATLDVNGDVNITGIITATTLTVTNINATGIVTAATFEVSSDINLKDNVQIIQSPLNKIIKIDGVTFNWKEDNKPSMGVIAQNIEEVIPELVSSGETKHVNYNGLIGLLIESIKELKSEIEELKKNINN